MKYRVLHEARHEPLSLTMSLLLKPAVRHELLCPIILNKHAFANQDTHREPMQYLEAESQENNNYLM